MPRRRKPTQPRRIEPSVEGRMRWKPGDEHPLDVLFDDAQQMREAVQEQLAALLVTAKQAEEQLSALLTIEQLDDPTLAVSVTDQVAQRAIWNRFKSRKHHDHLQAVFGLLRRRRQLGRLQAAQAALDLAMSLLAEEESLEQELLTALVAAEAKMQQEEQQDATESESPEPAPSLLQQTLLDDEVLEDEPGPDVIHVDTVEESDTDTSLVPVSGVLVPSAGPRRYDSITPLVGSVEAPRDALRQFEARIRELREQLTRSNGWVEIFYIPKWRLKSEVVAFLDALDQERKGVRVPREVQEAVHPRVVALFRAKRIHAREDVPKELMDEVFDIIKYGPYANYRWKEGKSPIYTVSLGPLKHIPNDDEFTPRF